MQAMIHGVRVRELARLVIHALAAGWTILLYATLAAASDWDRGVSLYNKGEYRAALVEFQDLVIERPDAAGAWYYIGLCEFKLKRYEKVELPLSHAIDLLEIQSPSSADIAGAWYTIGISHYLQARYEKAIDPLKRYIELTSKAAREIDLSARTALARSYFFLDRYEDALGLLSSPTDKSSSANSERTKELAANAYYRGAIYFKKEDDDHAIVALREAVKGNPEDVAALELLTESLMRKARKSNSDARWNEAAEVAEKLKSIRDDLKTANILGRAYLGAQRFDSAVAPLEKLAKANSDNGQAWLYYGIALSRSGRLRKAMEALEITIQLMPESIPALAELGYVYEADKQYQQALRVYEKAYAASGEPALKEKMDRVRALASQQP
jgi:tetratricopeptide (TPR) repeat protein